MWIIPVVGMITGVHGPDRPIIGCLPSPSHPSLAGEQCLAAHVACRSPTICMAGSAGSDPPAEIGDAACSRAGRPVCRGSRPGSRLPNETGAQRAYSRLAEHHQGRDQAAHQPGPGRDQAGPGHVRHPADRPVRDRAVDRPAGAHRRRGQGHLPVRRSTASERERLQGRDTAPRRSTDDSVEPGGSGFRRGQQVVSRHQRRYVDEIPVVPADVLLSDGVHHQGRHPSAQGRGHRRRHGASTSPTPSASGRWATATGSPRAGPDDNEADVLRSWHTMPRCSKSSVPPSTRRGRRCA